MDDASNIIEVRDILGAQDGGKANGGCGCGNDSDGDKIEVVVG